MPDVEHFRAGIRHLEVMFEKDLTLARKTEYAAVLNEIPNELWDEGILRVQQTARFFPSPAEIGEACIPGDAVTEEKDGMTGRWRRIETPWTVRLRSLSVKALPAPQRTILEEPPPVPEGVRERLTAMFQPKPVKREMRPLRTMGREEIETRKDELHRQLQTLTEREQEREI